MQQQVSCGLPGAKTFSMSPESDTLTICRPVNLMITAPSHIGTAGVAIMKEPGAPIDFLPVCESR